MHRIAPCWLALLLAGCDSVETSREASVQSLPPAAQAPAAAAPTPVAEDSARPQIAPVQIAKGDTASVPVHVGGEAEFDACGSVGKILPPKDGNGASLGLRRGPGRRFAVVQRLREGDVVLMCDWSEKADGAWSGVVIPGDADCGGLGSPIPQRQPYRGPCTSGWIPSGSIEVIAG